MDYKATLNLPQTDFSMRANSSQKEPEIQKFWIDIDIYHQNLKKRTGSKFILHDGPPYLSSGRIHIGHALNRVLKDIIVKYKTLNNHPSPMIFGYDCHGLPIEHEVLKQKGEHAQQLSPLEIRQACTEFAKENLSGQMQHFARLGLLGDVTHPYLTMQAAYEAAQLRIFADMVEKGYIYKGLKPVYWSIGAQTALAEAEVEYQEHTSTSLYVRFPWSQSERKNLPDFLKKEDQLFFVIWTTTPWTLPANLGIALNPDFEYVFVKIDQEVWIVAQKLLNQTLAETGRKADKILWTCLGKDLENVLANHPFYPRHSRVVLGHHVTSEAGTGCVHTAPGHGMEDFIVGEKYKLGILSPVDGSGHFTSEAPGFEGLFYAKANQKIIALLQEKNLLVHAQAFQHSYPHCWRTKTPLIYRATEQWFASVDTFREAALDAVDDVQWIPSSGRDRIYNMIQDRSDWCISRQRVWGVPIPAFYHQGSEQALLTKEVILNVADKVESYGTDIWWSSEADELLPEHILKTGSKWRKETDIMDVWFDSGTSHEGVLKNFVDLQFPADLYLEGSDQHRGWFQSSLLTAIAAHGQSPYKTVLTHGFVLDGQGRKMSKSLGNVVEPQKVIEQYGADVLRLWVASVDYSNDVKVSYDILKQLAEVYKKIRNTIRFLMSNLYDFEPQHALNYSELSHLDQYTLHKLQSLIGQVRHSFDTYQFSRFYHLIQNFCVIDLSNIYFAIVKDILYIEAADSPLRRSVQTVLWEVLQALQAMITPVLSHLAEDILQNLPSALKATQPESALLLNYPEAKAEWINTDLVQIWEPLLVLRNVLNTALEQARTQKYIGRSNEAYVQVHHPATELQQYLQKYQQLMRQVFIVAKLDIVQEIPQGEITAHGDSWSVAVLMAEGEKCERCWNTDLSVGKNPVHPQLCSRCETIVESCH